MWGQVCDMKTDNIQWLMELSSREYVSDAGAGEHNIQSLSRILFESTGHDKFLWCFHISCKIFKKALKMPQNNKNVISPITFYSFWSI